MTPWQLLERAAVPDDSSELRLYQRNHEFSIRLAGRGELMNSRIHGSEDALAQQTCARMANREQARMLIGGLGMGFTLAAALQQLGAQAQVQVAELVPAVVDWNRGVLGSCAGFPLNDPRVRLHSGDVSDVLRTAQQAFDAILLDVDNGPEGLTRKENNWLYSIEGLRAASAALRSQGILAVWSAGPAADFRRRLGMSGFAVEEIRVPAHGNRGTRHVIWLARCASSMNQKGEARLT
jgi:spermidine synthase